MNIQQTVIILLITTGSIIALTTLLVTLIQTFKQVRKLQAITHSYDTIKFPPPKPTSENFLVLIKEIVYEYLPDGKTIFQRKHQKLEALQNNIDHFEDRYRWTGRGTCVLKSLTTGYTIENQHRDEEGIWDYFDVKFPGPLKKGGIVDFTIEWKLIDEEHKALTFLSSMIDQETKYLLLQVNLPNEMAPKRAYFHEYEHFRDTLPSHTEPITWSPATKSISCEVIEPKKDHKYLIRWYYE